MATTLASQVQELYIGYLGRAADKAGLDFWVKAIENGTSTLESVALGFTLSAEYKAAYEGLTTSQLVAKVYQNVLGRAADADGLGFWVGEINKGVIKADTLVKSMINSLGAIDQLNMDNKVQAANTYTTTAGDNYDLAAAKAAIGATAGNSGQTFTLTAGIDNVLGTAGDDIIIGGGNGAGVTTGPADQIDGGAGADTFKFYGGNITGTMPTIKNVEGLYFNATQGTLNAAAIAGVESVVIESALDAAAAGHTVTLGAAQKLSLTNINGAVANVATTVLGTAAAGITLNNVVDTTVTPNGAQTLNVNTRDAALTLTAKGSASQVNLNNDLAGAATSLTTLNVDGDAALRVNANAAYTNLTTVDASKNTGGVNFVQGFDTNLTFTGGAGNDRVDVSIAAGAVNAQDKLDGGAGTDTIAISTGGLTAPAAANIKNFEVLEVRGATNQDASVFEANNTLTGLTVVNTAGVQAMTVTNLAATAKDNIVVNAGIAANTTTLTTTVKGFVSGGTVDSATVTVNANAASTGAASSVLNLTFDNVDNLNLVSNGTQATNANTINLGATDLEKVVVSGNIQTIITANAGAVVSAGITEVDASGLVVANSTANGLTFTQNALATQSILVTGTNGVDNITVNSIKGTVVANGGNDTVVFNGVAAAVGDQAVVLSAKDFVAGGALNVTFAAGSANNAIINFSSDIESKLIVGGANLGSTVANQAIGGVINGQNNVALVGGVLQFDVNGDGAFNAADDFSITLTGLNTTVTYNAAGDFFVLA